MRGRTIAWVGVAAIVFGAVGVGLAPPAGATLTNPNPPSATASSPGSARTDFDVEPPSGLSVCVRTSGAPARTHPTLSPASSVCGDADRGLALIVTVDRGATPDSYPITITEYLQDNPNQVIDRKSFTLLIAVPPTTSTSAATTTTRPPPTTVATAVAAPVTTTESTTTTEPPTTTTEESTTSATRRRETAAPAKRNGGQHTTAIPWLALGVVAVAGAAGLFLRQRAGRSSTSPTPSVATSAATATAMPTVVGTVPAVAAGLVTPLDAVVVPWGRAVPLRAGAADRNAQFSWRVEDVQSADSGRWGPWPDGRAPGGLRVRRAHTATASWTGSQALLLHPFLPSVGDVALVKLAIDVVNGSQSGTFPAWFRCERSADWEVTITAVHAPSAPALAPTRPPRADTSASAAAITTGLRIDAPPGPWSAGELLMLRVAFDEPQPVNCEWTASAGTFPAGNDTAAVVFAVPPDSGDVEITLSVTDTNANASRVIRTTVSVLKHVVLVAGDLDDGEHARARAVLQAAGHHVGHVDYDWRATPPESAPAFLTSVATNLAAAGAGTLDDAVATAASATVIAHGTAGLALRALLRELTARAVIDDAVFVGTPHHGMPIAFRWLRFGDRFATADVHTESWPVLVYALPGPPWLANAGPVLHDRQHGRGWIRDPNVTYTELPGALPSWLPVHDALAWNAQPLHDPSPVRVHAVIGRGVPTECLYSYGPVETVVEALADSLAATLAGALEGSPEVRSLTNGTESLVITMLDGDGVVPVASAAGSLQPIAWNDTCVVRGVAHGELLDDTTVLSYLVYVVEQLDTNHA